MEVMRNDQSINACGQRCETYLLLNHELSLGSNVLLQHRFFLAIAVRSRSFNCVLQCFSVSNSYAALAGIAEWQVSVCEECPRQTAVKAPALTTNMLGSTMILFPKDLRKREPCHTSSTPRSRVNLTKRQYETPIGTHMRYGWIP